MPPSTLSKMRRTLRPMVALARLALASALCVVFMPSARRIGPVDDDERRAAAGARGAAVQRVFGLAHRLDDRDDDRQILGQAAGHHRGDRDFLGGDAAAAHRLHADHVGGIEARGGKKARDRASVGGTIGKPSVQPLR